MQLFLCKRTGRLIYVPDYRRGAFTRSEAMRAEGKPLPDPDSVAVPWCGQASGQDAPVVEHVSWCCSWHAWQAMPDARRQAMERTRILSNQMRHGLTF